MVGIAITLVLRQDDKHLFQGHIADGWWPLCHLQFSFTLPASYPQLSTKLSSSLPKWTPGKTSSSTWGTEYYNTSLGCKEKMKILITIMPDNLCFMSWTPEYGIGGTALSRGREPSVRHSNVQLSLDFSKWPRKTMEIVRLFCLLTKLTPGWLSAGTFDSCVEGRVILLCDLRYLEASSLYAWSIFIIHSISLPT